MGNLLNTRYYPARVALVKGSPSQVMATAVEVFIARGFRVARNLDETTLEFEIGSAAREFWLGDSLIGRLLPGRTRALVVHGFAVAQVRPSETSDAGHPDTWLTIASVNGLETHADVREVIEECLAHFRRTALLLEVGEATSGLDLPVESPCNPKGYRSWKKAQRRR